jgi:hypothetical protein
MAEVGLWHVRPGSVPARLTARSLPSEKDLEAWIEGDPSLIAPGLHSVRRQVPLGKKFMDLLSVEAPGVWTVCELKKVALEREVLAQAIDYVARIEELTRDELAALAMANSDEQTPQARDLIQQALDREDNGEGREVRIVLAGVGVTTELTRMVTYLSTKFEVPIRVCTLSAVNAPNDDGLILIRDITEDTETEVTLTKSGSTYEERMSSVRAHFESHGLLPVFKAAASILDANPNLYLRPWKKALMVAPAANHSRCAVYLTPRKSGVFVMPVPETMETFFPGVDMAEIETLPTEESITSVERMTEWATIISEAIGTDESAGGVASKAQWNGTDWYVAFGHDDTRDWDDAREHGFVSAGGGNWYSRTLRNLPVGARVFVYIPKVGYVAAGITTGIAMPFTESAFIKTPSLRGTYTNSNGEPEFIVPVDWITAKPLDEALVGSGLFANQNSACKLRDSQTLERCYEFFDVIP